VQAARFNAQGIKVISDLTLIREESLKDSFTANNMLSVMVMMKLMALRTWTVRRANEFGRNNLNIDDFNDDVCLKEQEKCTVKCKSDAISDSLGDKSKDLVGLVKFDGKKKNWISSMKDFVSQVSNQMNSEGVPLSYVIRDDDDYIDIDDDDLDELTRRIKDALLEGKVFEQDNWHVYQFLMRWTSGGTAFTYVDQYETTRDGRAAFIALRLNYKGDDVKQAMITKAKNMIATAHFADSTSRFTIDDYCG
jgi:hypothetical protein